MLVERGSEVVLAVPEGLPPPPGGTAAAGGATAWASPSAMDGSGGGTWGAAGNRPRAAFRHFPLPPAAR